MDCNFSTTTKIEPLTGTNYPIWALKVGALLRGKKLFKCVISDPEPDIKDEVAWQIWSEKNDEAFGIIVTTLSDEQAGMFLDETKAKKVWDELKKIYTGNLEDKIIDIGLELKNIKVKNNESINEYMARAKNIASQSSSLEHQISQRELEFHIVRGIHPRLEKIAVVLRTRRDLTQQQQQKPLFRAFRPIQDSPYLHVNKRRGKRKHLQQNKIHRSKQYRRHIGGGVCFRNWAYRVYDIITKKIEEVRSVKFVENEKEINYAKNIQEDTNYDHFSYKKEEEDDIEIVHRTRPETSELNEETIPTLDAPNEERIVKSGRKKGDTQEVLEEKHRAKLREEEMKLLEQGVRRSQRIKERNNVNFILEPEERIPENYEEAINCENKCEWLEAMKEELYSINKHKVWTLVQREKNMKIINCKWIFSIKSTPSEGVYRRKARLVVIGCNQKYGVEYEESFSPVIRKESLRAIVALAAQLNLVITSYDVKTAYLYGELKETIFMKQPEGFVEKVGMERSQYDPCVYTFRKGKGYGILGLYVDDLIIAGTDKTFNEKLASEIGKFVALKEKGENEPFIGIEIKKTEYGFDLSQAHYIDKILKKFALEECNIVQTPGDRDQSFDECQDSKPVDKTLYQEMIGSLMYLATGTRPDISFNVSNLSRFCNDAREVHLTEVKRIYRYLNGTRDKMLRYKPSENSILVSTDASWCSTSDAKSYSGYTVKLGNNLISWRSKKQSLVALSTCEAELISICEGICEVKWIKGLLEELCKDANFPTTLKTDSQSAIKWIKSEKITSRTKHINRKLYFVKDAVEEGTIDLEFVRSDEMEADLLTKSLPKEKLKNCINSLGLKMESNVQMPKFDGKNFTSWKFRNISILEGKELDAILEADPPKEEEKFKEWKKRTHKPKSFKLLNSGKTASACSSWQKSATGIRPIAKIVNVRSNRDPVGTLPIVRVSINGNTWHLLYDTGSQVSIIDSERCKVLNEDWDEAINNLKIVSVTGNAQTLKKVKTCRVNTDKGVELGDISFWLMSLEDKGYGGILGIKEIRSLNIPLPPVWEECNVRSAATEDWQLVDIGQVNGKHQQLVRDILKQRSDMFVENVASLKAAKVPPIKIDVDINDVTFRRQYPIPYSLLEPYKVLLDNFLESGIIKRSRSDWNSPVHLVKKPDGSLRFMLDLKQVNDKLRNQDYPMIRIDTAMAAVEGAKYFSTLDLASGYYQLKLDSNVTKFFAFQTPFGKFEMSRLPQGCKISSKEENSSAFKVYSKDKYKHYKEMKTSKTYKCFICHKPGHKAAECWHNPENKKNTNVKQTFASQGSSGYKANIPNKYSKATFAKDENRNDFAKLVKQQGN
ncbi:hypothetical protein LAZ67_14002076, partial [Cordylochernes scorpioides]